MTTYLLAYVASLAVFLGLDALWLGLIAKDMFKAGMGDLLLPEPRLGVAAGFYVFYVVGIVYFAVHPALVRESLWLACLNGVLLGALAYATYELTGLAVIKGWPVKVAVVDIAWGAMLTGLAATAGYAAARWHGGPA